MKILDIRIISEQQNSVANWPRADVDMEIDGKEILVSVPLNSYEVNGPASLNNRYMNRNASDGLTLREYLPQIKRQVGALIAERAFAEWEKMEKLKQ